eukprot:TRINITY_DN2166_c0_g1_i24.p1 TRINITY_DN2166_c0_g1~~TRINITY_DN2166_c0_g1_i24.p1  ORF type:complete len:216 (+),score=26.70 TRINITY_DN2166_c0_g1_i24:595-1242(+)
MANGEVRGFHASSLGAEEIRHAPPFLKISKVLYDYTGESSGMIQLSRNPDSGFVEYESTDLDAYFKESEQIKTVSFLDVQQVEGKPLSLGYLLQALPECPGEYVDVLHARIIENNTWKQIASGKKGFDLNDISQMLEEMNADSEFYRYLVDFYCRCKLEDFKKLLVNLGEETVDDMQAQKQNTLRCNYCNKEYVLTRDDFEEIKGVIADEKRKNA